MSDNNVSRDKNVLTICGKASAMPTCTGAKAAPIQGNSALNVGENPDIRGFGMGAGNVGTGIAYVFASSTLGESNMNFYKFNFFANHTVQCGEVWANSRYDVERYIFASFPSATGIDIFLAQ